MYSLSIVTPEKIAYEGDVISLIAPGSLGYLEILTDHAPIITSLKSGELTLTDKDNKTQIFALHGGYLEFLHNKATILADGIERASEIDIDMAQLVLSKAIQKLELGDETIDIPRTKQAIEWAKTRIKIHNDYINSLQ